IGVPGRKPGFFRSPTGTGTAENLTAWPAYRNHLRYPDVSPPLVRAVIAEIPTDPLARWQSRHEHYHKIISLAVKIIEPSALSAHSIKRVHLKLLFFASSPVYNQIEEASQQRINIKEIDMAEAIIILKGSAILSNRTGDINAITTSTILPSRVS
ncbi:hypothetical protein ACOYSQ_005377, partial [Escherichia coli]